MNTLKDARRDIISLVSKEPIQELTHQFINKGKIRGSHCHPEFDININKLDETDHKKNYPKKQI